MAPGLPSQLELRVDSKPSAGSPRCGAATAPVCGAAAQEKKKPCYVPRGHAGGSTTLGLRWSLVGGSMTDASLRHMTFRHWPPQRAPNSVACIPGLPPYCLVVLPFRADSPRHSISLERRVARYSATMLVMPATRPA